MRLSGKTVFVAAILVTLGCNDLAAPPSLPAGFALEDISGRPLPTFVSPIPEAPTIVYAHFQLAADGKATLTEYLHEVSGADAQIRSNYTYQISGNQIQFDYDPPCAANALCAAPPRGSISGTRLRLAMGGANSGVVYNFRLVTDGIVEAQ
jgi:hypothetical protein